MARDRVVSRCAWPTRSGRPDTRSSSWVPSMRGTTPRASSTPARPHADARPSRDCSAWPSHEAPRICTGDARERYDPSRRGGPDRAPPRGRDGAPGGARARPVVERDPRIPARDQRPAPRARCATSTCCGPSSTTARTSQTGCDATSGGKHDERAPASLRPGRRRAERARGALSDRGLRRQRGARRGTQHARRRHRRRLSFVRSRMSSILAHCRDVCMGAVRRPRGATHST